MSLLKKLQQTIGIPNNLIRLNKYSLVILLFVFWMSLFDKHSFIKQVKLSNTISELQDNIEDYDQQYDQAIKEKYELEKDKEKFAREHHNFSRENEELFIIKNQ